MYKDLAERRNLVLIEVNMWFNSEVNISNKTLSIYLFKGLWLIYAIKAGKFK